MKYLIVGLGNIGREYEATRHNIGFRIADALSERMGTRFETKRYGDVATGRIKNAQLVLLKPSTYMNLSGEAVRYWMSTERITIDHVLVLVDDLALPFGTLRLFGRMSGEERCFPPREGRGSISPRFYGKGRGRIAR